MLAGIKPIIEEATSPSRNEMWPYPTPLFLMTLRIPSKKKRIKTEKNVARPAVHLIHLE